VIKEFPCTRKETQCHFAWLKNLRDLNFHASYQGHIDYYMGGTIAVQVWHVEVGPTGRSLGEKSLGVGALGSQLALRRVGEKFGQPLLGGDYLKSKSFCERWVG
jgi:hypothetical protein